jgi:hypothetical protein
MALRASGHKGGFQGGFAMDDPDVNGLTEPLLSVGGYNGQLLFTKIQRPTSPGAHRHVH